jgi:LemA protein
MIGYVIAALIVVLAIVVIVMYNNLVRLNIRTDEAWSDIDVQLKRRYDLIPNLVETVKGYAKHEKETFEMVTSARTVALGAKSVGDKAKAENQIEGALKSIFAIAEAYPELKANANFAQLQSDLTDTEDKIQAARRFYNANVRDMNIAIQTFPTNLMAAPLGFKKRVLFELDNVAARDAVKVDFNN